MNFKANLQKALFGKMYIRPFDWLDLHGVGAEVGVNYGYHARQLLKRHPAIKQIHLIDPYPTEKQGYTQEKRRPVAERVARRRMEPFGLRAIFHRSDAKSATLPRLDFCYIDGDHIYGAVKSDIASIWPCIKHGGIMGGHDFHATWPGTIRAVIEFAVANNLQLHVDMTDWWVVKL